MRRRRRRSWSDDRFWPRYVTVAERKATAARRMEKLIKKGEKLDPVILEGRTIARTFWGKGWCTHLENHCDFWNRLGRGRSYIRSGAVCDLAVEPGRVTARVLGTDLYRVDIAFRKLPASRWKSIREASTGQISSVVELLCGRLSDAVMKVMTDPENGLFPRENEIELKCSCPDYAVMCKHVAAVLYGVGARLDRRPELLFVLRGVDTAELFDEAVESGVVTKAAAGPSALDEKELSEIFGVEIDIGAPVPADAPQARKRKTEPTRPKGKAVKAGSEKKRGRPGKTPAGRTAGQNKKKSRTRK
ncbi:MAG: SWIM zinc finger family protein [Acidobacteriota bacterium]|nr:SWIM zinc finger family protein [Acidobacteriota bacterium]